MAHESETLKYYSESVISAHVRNERDGSEKMEKSFLQTEKSVQFSVTVAMKGLLFVGTTLASRFQRQPSAGLGSGIPRNAPQIFQLRWWNTVEW